LLHQRFGEDAEIKAGKSGQFDVVVDGQLIFSKAEVGRFPVNGEVEDLFATLKPLPGRPLKNRRPLSRPKKTMGTLERECSGTSPANFASKVAALQRAGDFGTSSVTVALAINRD
jgi:hypothetical protein